MKGTRPLDFLPAQAIPEASGFERLEARLDIEERKDGAVYCARLSLSGLGLTEERLHEGFRFNLRRNDADATPCETVLQLSPSFGGMGDRFGGPFVAV